MCIYVLFTYVLSINYLMNKDVYIKVQFASLSRNSKEASNCKPRPLIYPCAEGEYKILSTSRQ